MGSTSPRGHKMPHHGSNTKDRIARSLKTLTARKSFHKITINDIAGECGMTRENFYYHFRDKYDIVNWIILKEIINPLSDIEDFESWIKQLIFAIDKDRGVYRRLVREVGKDMVKENLYPLMESRIRTPIDQSLDSSVWNMRKEKIDFATSYFANAFIEFVFHNTIDHEILDHEIFEYNYEFLICNFLTFVRIQKENNFAQE